MWRDYDLRHTSVTWDFPRSVFSSPRWLSMLTATVTATCTDNGTDWPRLLSSVEGAS
jgi:hypothetical protein